MRLVDTAGMRRRGKVASGPDAERFSALRALRAIGRADVALLVLDAVDGLTAQDAHVAGYVVDEGVGLVVAINKWDLVEKDDKTFEEYSARLRREAPFLDFAPIVAISAKTGQRVGRVLDAALEIARGRGAGACPRRRSTGSSREAVARQPAPPVRNVRPRFYYATQAAIEPPTFVLFASERDGPSTSATSATSRTGCATRSGSGHAHPPRVPRALSRGARATQAGRQADGQGKAAAARRAPVGAGRTTSAGRGPSGKSRRKGS